MNARFWARIALAVALSMCCRPCRAAGVPDTGSGAVAADHLLASEAGASMLRRGGNAVDAAVAASFTLSVVRPFSCGIGGGGFMVICLPAIQADAGTGRAARPALRTALNYRETCPAGIGPDFYEKTATDPDATVHGGAAVATPGTVAGLLMALERFGTLDRAAVLEPAIRAAREGFVVDRAYATMAAELIEKFQKKPAMKERFAFVWDRFLQSGKVNEGDTIRLPEQAEALRLIARDGAGAFYSGPIAEAILRTVHADGGPLSREDLAGYSPRQTDPLVVDRFGGRTMLFMPPPSSGGVALAEIFGLLQQRNIDRVIADGGAGGSGGGPYLFELVEAFKLAFADRARYLADPAFVPVPTTRLISDEHARRRAALIRNLRTGNPEQYAPADEGAPRAPADDGGTSHISVVDRSGGAVACTETINLEFGSLLVVAPYGFALNNQMDDFATRAGEANAFGLRQSDANRPQPGKRPLSSMSPTIVLDPQGRVELVAGASGGPRIITATAQVMLNVLLFNMPAAEAVAAPRVHHQWLPNTLELEPLQATYEGTPVPAWLAKVGHQTKPAKSKGVVQIVRRLADGTCEAASDPRKGGKAVVVGD